jgi:hypothetical protein
MTTTPCRGELPCPSSCALTAPAVFDGVALVVDDLGEALKICCGMAAFAAAIP